MSILRRGIPAVLLGMLLCLIFCIGLSSAAWADGSNVSDLQAAVERGDKSFTLTGSMTIPEGTEIVSETITVIVPKGKTLLINGGVLDVSALRLEGGNVELRGKILRVNDSFSRTGGSVKVYSGFNAFPAKDIWPDNTGAIQYPNGVSDSTRTDLLFSPKSDGDFVSAVDKINDLTDTYNGRIMLFVPCTIESDIVIRHKTMINIDTTRGGRLNVAEGGSLRYEKCAGTVTFMNVDTSKAESMQADCFIEGTMQVNSIYLGWFNMLSVSGTLETGTLDMDMGVSCNVWLQEGCTFRVINSFKNMLGKVHIEGPCYNAFPAESVWPSDDDDENMLDCFAYADEDHETITRLLHYPKSNAEMFTALAHARTYTGYTRFRPDILAEFAWEPSDTVSIPRDTILRFRGGKGSLLVPEGCSVNYTDSGELLLQNGAKAEVKGELNGDFVSVGEDCDLVVSGKMYANRLDIHQNARVNVDCGSLDVPGRIWNGGELTLIDSWIDTGAETWREADEGAIDRINYEGDAGINLHFEVEDGEQAAEVLRQASEILRKHVRAQVEVKAEAWSIDEKLTIPRGVSVKVHKGLTLFSDAVLVVNGQLALVDDSTGYFYGPLVNAGFIETEKRSSGSGPRLIVEGGYYGPGSFGVKDSSKPDSYFRGLDLSLFRKETDSIGTRYFPTAEISPELTLPASLTAIEAEAFAGGSFRSVFIPQGVEQIDDTAFDDSALLLIFGYPDTEAQRFADSKGFAFAAIG